MILLYDNAEACERDSTRFWAKVDKSGGEDACWPWTAGRKNEHGYGGFTVRVNDRWKTAYAHRVAAMLGIGPMPVGAHVLHRCDFPPCCNPEHLEYGDAKENCRQMHERRRDNKPRGARHPKARVTEDVVRAIWDAVAGGAGVRETGRRFGLAYTTVRAIISGKSWAHLGLSPLGPFQRGRRSLQIKAES